MDARQGLLDERLGLIPRCREGDVGLVSRAAAGEQGEDTALPVEDDRAESPPSEKAPRPLKATMVVSREVKSIS